jgi:hypothetical protein
MRRASAAALFYCLVTLALTYPLVLHLGSVFPHDPGDPALNTWILWWNAQTIPLTDAWWNAPAFYPASGAVSFSESLLGLSLIATPVQWLGGSPLLAYNIVFLMTFPLCAVGGYLLALEITRRHDAAFIAGLLFGFAPYRMSQLAHVQVLAAFGMPFALLGLHRYLRDPRLRWLALFGIAWLIQALCNGYFLLFFSALIGMWILWFASPLAKPQVFRAIVVTLCVAAVPLLPILWGYTTIHRRLGFVRDFGTTRHYGADALAFFSTEPALALWGWLQLYSRGEGQLFPGVAIIALVIGSVWLLRREFAVSGQDHPASRRWKVIRRVLFVLFIGAAVTAVVVHENGPRQVRLPAGSSLSMGNPVKPLTGALAVGIVLLLTSRRVRWAYSTQSVLGFYVVAAFVMWLFSLGPAPTLMGEPLMYRGPYALLMNLPGFSALRVPARFWMVSILCLAVASAMLFHRVGLRFPKARVILATALAVIALADGWIAAFPLAAPPELWRTNACVPRGGTGAVMELPLGLTVGDVGAMYRSISHERPTVNGYSGNFPPHYAAVRLGVELLDRGVLMQLASRGLDYVVINRGHRQERAFRRYVAGVKGVELVCSTDAHLVYRLPQPVGSHLIAKSGRADTSLPVASVSANVNNYVVGLMMDGDLATRWDTGPQSADMMLEIDLGMSRTVSAVEMSLGQFSSDFPRGLRIEASDDRNTWREVWRGTSAGLAMMGALRDPATLPLLYDLESTRARYLRFSLTEKDDTYYWSIAELKVLGPVS